MSSDVQPQSKPHVRHSSKASLSANTTISPSTVKIHPSSFLHDKATVITTPPHTITLEPNSQVHAFAKLEATTCSITVGEGCIVWERAVLGSSPSASSENATPLASALEEAAIARAEQISAPLQTHTNAQIHPHAIVHPGAIIASNAVIECHATIGANASIGAWARVASKAIVPPHTRVPDFMVVMGGSSVNEAGADGRQHEIQLHWRLNSTLKADERVRVLMERGHGHALEGLAALGMGMGKGVRSMGTSK